MPAVAKMRQSEFDQRVSERFGRYADSLLRDLVLPELGGRTGNEALAAGTDPRDVWRALCDAKEVPLAER
jgi:hypothetical protein